MINTLPAQIIKNKRVFPMEYDQQQRQKLLIKNMLSQGQNIRDITEPEPDHSIGNQSSHESATSYEDESHPLSRRSSFIERNLSQRCDNDNNSQYLEQVKELESINGQQQEAIELQQFCRVIRNNTEQSDLKQKSPIKPQQINSQITQHNRIEKKISKKVYRNVGIVACVFDIILALYIISGVIYYEIVQIQLHENQDSSFKWQLLITILFEVIISPFSVWILVGALIYYKRAYCCTLIFLRLVQSAVLCLSAISQLVLGDCSIDYALRPFMDCNSKIMITILVIRSFYDAVIIISAIFALSFARRMKELELQRRLQYRPQSQLNGRDDGNTNNLLFLE